MSAQKQGDLVELQLDLHMNSAPDWDMDFVVEQK